METKQDLKDEIWENWIRVLKAYLKTRGWSVRTMVSNNGRGSPISNLDRRTWSNKEIIDVLKEVLEEK